MNEYWRLELQPEIGFLDWRYLAIIAGGLAVLGLVLRIAFIERTHRDIRNVLEKRVTQRTRDLERAYSLTDQVVNAVTEGIVVVGPEGEAVFVNPAARVILGIDDSDLDPPRICDTFEEQHPEVHRVLREHFQHLDGHETFTVSATVLGRVRTFEISASSMTRRSDHDLGGVIYVFRDVTEALTLLEMKSRFVSIVSHEIRTPLTSLSGSLDLLDTGVLGPVPERAADMISVARHSTDRLVRLVNDVLDLDRLESDRVLLEPTWQSTDDLMVETLRTLQPLATKGGVNLVREGGPYRIRVDHDRIVQVMLNLVQNAIKFSPPSTTILVNVSRNDDDIVFTIDDEGRGIPPHQLERIFEPFTQADSSDDRRHSGTGLGLTISRGIVRRHGGRIWAENRDPRGARLTFTIPFEEESP